MSTAAAVIAENNTQRAQAKLTVYQGFVVAAISVFVSIATIGAIYANTQSRLAAVENRQVEAERKFENVQRQLDRIQDRMVDKDLFNETRSDVKELLKRK